jgi:GMP reductase
MDTTGTFEMAKALSKHKTITAMSKHINAAQYTAFLDENPVSTYDTAHIHVFM